MLQGVRIPQGRFNWLFKMAGGVVDFTGRDEEAGRLKEQKRKRSQRNSPTTTRGTHVRKRSKRLRGHCHRPPPKPLLLRELERKSNVSSQPRGKRAGRKNTRYPRTRTSTRAGDAHHEESSRGETGSSASISEPALMQRAGASSEAFGRYRKLWRSVKAGNVLVSANPSTDELSLAALCVPACIFASLAGKPRKSTAHSVIVVSTGKRAEELANRVTAMLSGTGRTVGYFHEGSNDVQEQVATASAGVAVAVGTAKRLDALAQARALEFSSGSSFVALEEPEREQSPRHLNRLRKRFGTLKRTVVLSSPANVVDEKSEHSNLLGDDFSIVAM